MRRRVFLLTVLLFSCGRPAAQRSADLTPASGAVAFDLTWDQPPVAHGDNAATLAVTPPDAPVVITDVDPTMPAHGHGTIKAHQKITRDDAAPGHFRLTGLRFVMPGAWRITVRYELDGTRGSTDFQADVR